jgi:hypothetical protein
LVDRLFAHDVFAGGVDRQIHDEDGDEDCQSQADRARAQVEAAASVGYAHPVGE